MWSQQQTTPPWKKTTSPTGPPGLAAAQSAQSAVAEEIKAKVTKVTTDLACTETVTNTTIDTSNIVLENEKATVQSYKSSLESLERQQKKLMEMQTGMTKDWAEAQKCPAARASVADIGKLRTQCNELCKKVVIQISKIKPKMNKLQAEAELKVKETADTNTFRPVLAKLKVDVTNVESAVNSVSRQAEATLSKPPEDTEAKDKKVASIETAASEALQKHEATKKVVAEALKDALKYAPETKKTAQAAIVELQKKMTEAFKTANVYKTFKKDFPRLVINQKAVVEATNELSGHDMRISKSETIAKASKLSKKQCQAIDENFDPVKKGIAQANVIMQKIKGADAATATKFTQLRERIAEMKKKMDEVITKVKPQMDVCSAEDAIDTAKENLEKVEEHWKKCQEAEMPFLTGVEVLPAEISEKTIKACSESSAELNTSLTAAKAHLASKMGECKTYEKELAKKTTEELTAVRTELMEIDGHFGKYKKELIERKVASILEDATDAVVIFQRKTKEAEAAGKALTSATLEDEAVEAVQAAIEKTTAALTEVGTSFAEAKKIINAKSAEAKVGNNSPQVARINETVGATAARVSKLQATVKAAEKLLKTKAVITTGEEKVNEAEDASKNAEGLVPATDTMTVEAVASMDEAFAAAVKKIKETHALLSSHLAGAPAKTKATLQELVDRVKAAQAAVDKAKADSKPAREAGLAEHFLAEAGGKFEAAEAAATKMEEAESPFLVGATLDLKATLELLAKCRGAATGVNEAVAAARSYISQKTAESKSFGEDAGKTIKDGFADISERLAQIAAKQATSEKDIQRRIKEARMTEASEKVDEFDSGVKKVLAAAEPFTKEGAEGMTEAEAEQPLKAFMEIDKIVRKQAQDLKGFLGMRQKEQAGNKENLEALKELLEKVTKTMGELATVKKATAPHEQRASAKLALAEAKEQAAGLEGAIKTSRDACAPLLDNGGLEFLIDASLHTLAAALQIHIKEEELTDEAYFKSIGKGKAVPEKEFLKYLQELPRVIGHDELNAFSEERRLALFKRIAGDGKSVTLDAFKGFFTQKYVCLRSVVFTDKLSVKESETLGKLEANEELELSGPVQEDEGGLQRSQCKVGDKTGWVTIKQNKGPVYLAVNSPFKAFGARMDKALGEASTAVQKAVVSVTSKLKQMGTSEDAKEAREEMVKLKEAVDKSTKAMAELKAQVAKARGTYIATEKAERTAHIDARNQKEAAPFLDGPKAKMETLEADAKAVEEASAPMASLTKDELEAFATPGSVLEKTEKAAAAVVKSAAEAREAVKEQREAASAVSPPTAGSALAKTSLAMMTAKVEELSRKSSQKCSIVKTKCGALISAKMEPAAAAIRKSAQEKGKSALALFDTLKQGDKIPEPAFCKLLASLEGLSLSAELAKLVSRKLEADGISKGTFVKFVGLYYKVLKTIAFTDDQDITKCNTIRKAEGGEIVEVLEGPVLDESSGMSRIRAKSLSKSDGTEGWITVGGSKGTVFCQKCDKPEAKEP